MAAGFNYISDLYEIYSVSQNTCIRMPKDFIIASLKEFFGRDSKYHFSSDDWGYPLTPDLTDVPIEAGLFDDITTRIFIGDQNRFATIFYPAILVKPGSFRSVPISLNRDKYNVEYKSIEFYDDNGNRKWVNMPDKFVGGGAWEGSLNIEVQSRGIRERDDLVELISLYFVDLNWDNLSRAGVSIKPDVSMSSPSEGEDRNDKLFKQTITINIRGEWRREIPITDIIDVITFCVEFGNVDGNTAPNLQVNTEIELEDSISSEDEVL